MKWHGSMEKTHFLDWAKKATKEELQEYVVEGRYPSTRAGKLRRALTWSIIIILYVVFMVGIAAMGALFLISGAYNDYVEATIERHDNIGESVCGDFGGFIVYGYKEDVMYAQCSDKIILLDGNPLP